MTYETKIDWNTKLIQALCQSNPFEALTVLANEFWYLHHHIFSVDPWSQNYYEAVMREVEKHA